MSQRIELRARLLWIKIKVILTLNKLRDFIKKNPNLFCVCLSL